MPKDAQILAMATLHGLVDIKPGDRGDWWASAPFEFLGSWCTALGTPARFHGRVPSYLTDLNAVAEVEALVIRSLSCDHQYVGMLMQLSAPHNTIWSPLRALACASAADRVEALLRLKGLWTGDDSP